MLTAETLACHRGSRLVFQGAGFAVAPGGFMLVAGPNGSGKSSLLRILAGLLPPHAGAVRWQGQDIGDDAAAHRSRTSYIGHLDAVKPDLTARGMLGYWRALRGLTNAGIEESLDAFALGKLADRPVKTLSAGQKRKLSLSRLASSASALWLLDEPGTALDAAGLDLLRAHIARHRATGGMVIAAAHEDLNIPDTQKFDIAGFAR